MRFMRVVLSRQVGQEVVLSDGRTMVVEKVQNTTVIGEVEGKLVSVLHQAVSELKGDTALNAMVKRNIDSGLIEITKPIYLDPKTNKVVKMFKKRVNLGKRVKETPIKAIGKVLEDKKKVVTLHEGDYILLEKEGDLVAVIFENYTKNKDINCKNKKGERFQVPKNRFVSKIEIVS